MQYPTFCITPIFFSSLYLFYFENSYYKRGVETQQQVTRHRLIYNDFCLFRPIDLIASSYPGLLGTASMYAFTNWINLSHNHNHFSISHEKKKNVYHCIAFCFILILRWDESRRWSTFITWCPYQMSIHFLFFCSPYHTLNCSTLQVHNLLIDYA